MADVFISYARSTAKQAQAAAKALRALGYSVWMDDELPAHRTFTGVIQEQLDAAKAALVIWSADAVASEWVLSEANRAREGRKLVQVRVDNSPLPMPFDQLQCAELSGGSGAGWRREWAKVTASIAVLVQDAGAAAQMAEPPEPRGPNRRLWIAAAAILVLGIAGAVAVSWWPRAASGPPVVRFAGLTALGPDVPANLPASLTDDVRIAFGADNVVILRERDPDFVLSGTVRRVDDKLRLSVKLEDAREGTLLWSGVREWPSDLKVSRYNATSLTQVLRCGLLDGAADDADLPPHSLALFLQYCDARLSITGQAEHAVTIIRRLQQEQPQFGRGWSSLAWSIQVAILQDPKRADVAALRAEAKAAAARALRLDPRDAQAYEVQAYALPETDHVGREQLLRRASEGRLTACGCELVGYGDSLADVGRAREAVVQFQRAHQREPQGLHAANLSFGYAAMGDAERSDQAFAKWSEIFAGTPGFLSIAMQRAAYVGRWSEAAGLAVDGARPASRDALIAAFEALASGDPARIAVARPGVERVAAASTDPWFYGVVLAALGDWPAALDVVARTGDPSQLFHPAFLTLRHDARYLDVLERQGLLKYWRETRTRPDLCRAPDPPAFCKTLG